MINSVTSHCVYIDSTQKNSPSSDTVKIEKFIVFFIDLAVSGAWLFLDAEVIFLVSENE